MTLPPASDPEDAAVFCSSVGILIGDFAPLAERLAAGCELTDLERRFLTELMSGEHAEFVVRPRGDGRKYRRDNLEHSRRRTEIALYVRGLVLNGMALERAYAKADDRFRNELGNRPASIRSAYREIFPAESEGPELGD